MKKTKKLLSLLLCAVMAVGLMPTMVFATEGDACSCTGIHCTHSVQNKDCPVCKTNYELCEGTSIKINGTALENGKSYKYGNGTVKYDADTDTLTLNNATIEQTGNADTVRIDGGTLKIVLQGKNKIISGVRGTAVYTDSVNITIQGSQANTLDVQSTSSAIWVLHDDLTVDGAKLTINCGSQGLMCNYGELIIKNKADITVESTDIAVGGDYGVSITDSTVNATSTDTQMNALICGSSFDDEAGILTVNNSTVNATCTSDTAFPAIYTYGGIKVEKASTLTATGKGVRGIYVDGYMTVSENSTVTATSAAFEGIVTADYFSIDNSTVNATSGDATAGIWCFGEFNISGASDVTAIGGLTVGYNDPDKDIWLGTATITPPEGGLLEVKVGMNTDGTGASHFDDASVVSPYSEPITFKDEELKYAYQYFRCKTHTHTGTAATCTDKAVCKDCNKEYGDALGHDWSEVTYKWNGTGACTAERVCKNDNQHKETATAVITSKVTKPATCTDEGTKLYTATFAENWADTQTKSDVIPAEGHTFGKVTYSWNGTNTCMATRTCAKDNYTETAYATITSKVTTAPTQTDKGTEVFTAVFAEDWASKQADNGARH